MHVRLLFLLGPFWAPSVLQEGVGGCGVSPWNHKGATQKPAAETRMQGIRCSRRGKLHIPKDSLQNGPIFTMRADCDWAT